ncbi:cytochrome b N-terminal domain-containing protein [Acidiphilium sp.]|uniref:cytochrome b N-terminal domain-containing protein n=1 Tax=Acidiphilium sp. TaxID=527 RepID=UPI003CFD76DA
MRQRPSRINWIEARLPLAAWYRVGWRDHPVPANLPFAWSFAAMVAVALAVLTITGIWLGLAYTPTPQAAALSIVIYTRTVPFGWLIEDLHRDGATMLFGVVYLDLFQGLYFATYRNRRELAWILEVVRFAVFLVIGFFGYAMTGSPASRAAMLIMAEHIAAIPLLGPTIALDFRGGPTLGATSLPHMAMTHIAIGFLVLLIAMLGYVASRMAPPANPDGIAGLDPRDLVPQSSYNARLFLAFIVFAVILALIMLISPGWGYPTGPARLGPFTMRMGPLPPWYLLVFHGFARAGITPAGGTALTFLALGLLAALPWLDRGRVASARYRPVYGAFVILFALDLALLGYAAAQPSRGIWPIVIDAATIWCFAHLIVVTPVVTRLEPRHIVPARITRRRV